MVDIPRTIKFDFLCLLIGLLAISLTVYFFLINPSNSLRLYDNTSLYIIFGIFVSFGVPFFVFGFYEMFKNYKRESEIIDIELKIKKLY